ncbi:SIS domain-containing protein [Saccharopolyspora sp. NPDC000359]|uniref:SIS domain-containing protein n=1 Tax=Saccharopolyspora sp. NPDC000359 TaxID=3154251 RepID=UPI003328D140
MTTTEAAPGTSMAAEIAEQPQVLADLVRRAAEFRAVAEQLARARPRFVLFAARGSSDNAALYGKYLAEVLLGLPAGLVSPSTTTLYGAAPDLTDVALVAVSQSGGSPDLVEVTEQAARRGAVTVAVTNTPDSPLGAVARHTLDIGAGAERAVAATKTYSATLLALHLLVAGMRGEHSADRIGDLAQSCLDANAERVVDAAHRLRFADRIITTARGYSLSTAHEAALKLAETSYLVTRAYSGADLLHGPIAAVGPETAVLAVTGTGPGGAAMAEPLSRLAAQRAEVLRVGAGDGAQLLVPELPEELSPVLEVLPLQQLAWQLATSRGYDPDRPAGLRKVTETR